MQADITQQSYPALYQLLYLARQCNETPFGCSECPFAGESDDYNIADPDEGHYPCKLLNKEVWGEGCSANLKDWQERAWEEIGGLELREVLV